MRARAANERIGWLDVWKIIMEQLVGWQAAVIIGLFLTFFFWVSFFSSVKTNRIHTHTQLDKQTRTRCENKISSYHTCPTVRHRFSITVPCETRFRTLRTTYLLTTYIFIPFLATDRRTLQMLDDDGGWVRDEWKEDSTRRTMPWWESMTGGDGEGVVETRDGVDLIGRTKIVQNSTTYVFPFWSTLSFVLVSLPFQHHHCSRWESACGRLFVLV